MSDVSLRLRPMHRDDWSEVAALIQESTNGWYRSHGRAPIFTCSVDDMLVYCQVYEDLDPDCCVVAEDLKSGRILGSCFYHPRPTHVALGIMNAHPDAFGGGVARQLLRFVTMFADAEEKPVRLVSSAINLDSYSLYSRAGFVPYAVYQDMFVKVPDDGFPVDVARRKSVRPACVEDAEPMAALETELCGIERAADYHYFLANDAGIWHASVLPGEDGGLDGFLVSVSCPASNMLGPGAMRDEAAAAALIAAELDHHRGRRPVWLAPADRPALVQELYSWGARNCELHFAQVRGALPRPPAGIAMPTFLPETG